MLTDSYYNTRITTIYFFYITPKRPAKVESLPLLFLSRMVTNCTCGQTLFCQKGAGIKVVCHKGTVGMKAFYFLEFKGRFTYLSNIVLFELLEKEDV